MADALTVEAREFNSEADALTVAIRELNFTVNASNSETSALNSASAALTVETSEFNSRADALTFTTNASNSEETASTGTTNVLNAERGGQLKEIPHFNVFDVELQVHFSAVFVFGDGVAYVERRAGGDHWERFGLVKRDACEFA